jgi:hypothetical protein
MNADEIFIRWKERRAAVEFDASFASRVMGRLPRPASARKSPWLAAAVVIVCLGSAALHMTFVLLLTLAGLNQGN